MNETTEGDDWRKHGLCQETDPEAFFPEKGESTKPAKRICAACEFKTPCLQYALDNGERFGVWGGYSERERRRMGRGEKVAPPAPVERIVSRCRWCNSSFLGDQKYCSKQCSSSASRARKVA